MTIFHAIGLIWVILTSCLASVMIFVFAFDGLRVRVRTGIIHINDAADSVSVPTPRLSIFPTHSNNNPSRN